MQSQVFLVCATCGILHSQKKMRKQDAKITVRLIYERIGEFPAEHLKALNVNSNSKAVRSMWIPLETGIFLRPWDLRDG
jgi:hypothetical protein